MHTLQVGTHCYALAVSILHVGCDVRPPSLTHC